MPQSSSFSIAQLRQALKITEKIESLQAQLTSLLGDMEPAPRPAATIKANGSTRAGSKMSAATRAKMSAAQQARRGKSKAPAAVSEPAETPGKRGKGKAPVPAKEPAAPAPKKGGLTPEGRAKLAEAMRARWAARQKGAPAPNAPAA